MRTNREYERSWNIGGEAIMANTIKDGLGMAVLMALVATALVLSGSF